MHGLPLLKGGVGLTAHTLQSQDSGCELIAPGFRYGLLP